MEFEVRTSRDAFDGTTISTVVYIDCKDSHGTVMMCRVGGEWAVLAESPLHEEEFYFSSYKDAAQMYRAVKLRTIRAVRAAATAAIN